jgi:hypothetical protein
MKAFVANYLVEHHHLLLPSDVLQLQPDLLFPQGLKPEPHEPTLQEVDTKSYLTLYVKFSQEHSEHHSSWHLLH